MLRCADFRCLRKLSGKKEHENVLQKCWGCLRAKEAWHWNCTQTYPVSRWEKFSEDKELWDPVARIKKVSEQQTSGVGGGSLDCYSALPCQDSSCLRGLFEFKHKSEEQHGWLNITHPHSLYKWFSPSGGENLCHKPVLLSPRKMVKTLTLKKESYANLGI